MRTPSGVLPAPPARERALLPVVAVMLVLAVVVFGGYVTAAALSSPAGPPVEVPGVARVTPLSGWELAGRSSDPPGVRLTRGSANLDVTAVPFTGGSADLLRGYVEQVLERDAEQLSVSEVEGVVLGSGVRASRIAYVGTFADVQAPIEGQVTALVTASSSGVIFDGWGPFGVLRYAVDDIETMIERAQVA